MLDGAHSGHHTPLAVACRKPAVACHILEGSFAYDSGCSICCVIDRSIDSVIYCTIYCIFAAVYGRESMQLQLVVCCAFCCAEGLFFCGIEPHPSQHCTGRYFPPVCMQVILSVALHASAHAMAQHLSTTY